VALLYSLNIFTNVGTFKYCLPQRLSTSWLPDSAELRGISFRKYKKKIYICPHVSMTATELTCVAAIFFWFIVWRQSLFFKKTYISFARNIRTGYRGARWSSWCLKISLFLKFSASFKSIKSTSQMCLIFFIHSQLTNFPLRVSFSGKFVYTHSLFLSSLFGRPGILFEI